MCSRHTVRPSPGEFEQNRAPRKPWRSTKRERKLFVLFSRQKAGTLQVRGRLWWLLWRDRWRRGALVHQLGQPQLQDIWYWNATRITKRKFTKHTPAAAAARFFSLCVTCTLIGYPPRSCPLKASAWATASLSWNSMYASLSTRKVLSHKFWNRSWNKSWNKSFLVLIGCKRWPTTLWWNSPFGFVSTRVTDQLHIANASALRKELENILLVDLRLQQKTIDRVITKTGVVFVPSRRATYMDLAGKDCSAIPVDFSLFSL